MERTAKIETGELITCKICGAKFRWIPRNSTIKPKLCMRCYNKSMLEKSTFARKNKFEHKVSKYTFQKENPGKRRKKSPKSLAMRRADNWFSRYIRCKYHFQILTDGTVLNKCIITGVVKEAKNMDNGHCFSRKFILTRYEEDNCRPQNKSSNQFSGEADHYKFIDNLIIQIGEERFNRLDELRKQEGQATTQFYEEQAEKYRELTNEMVKELKIKKWW
jgi:hypothetical protein